MCFLVHMVLLENIVGIVMLFIVFYFYLIIYCIFHWATELYSFA